MVLLGQDWLAGTGRRKQQAIRAMTETRLTKTGYSQGLESKKT